jgi:hypothetical protein
MNPESRIPNSGGGVPFLPSPGEGWVGALLPGFGIQDSGFYFFRSRS